MIRAWRQRGKDEAYCARLITHADDFVILSRGHAAEALAWTRRATTHIGLALNEAKTCLRQAREAHVSMRASSCRPEQRERLERVCRPLSPTAAKIGFTLSHSCRPFTPSSRHGAAGGNALMARHITVWTPDRLRQFGVGTPAGRSEFPFSEEPKTQNPESVVSYQQILRSRHMFLFLVDGNRDLDDPTIAAVAMRNVLRRIPHSP